MVVSLPRWLVVKDDFVSASADIAAPGPARPCLALLAGGLVRSRPPAARTARIGCDRISAPSPLPCFKSWNNTDSPNSGAPDTELRFVTFHQPL